MGGLDGKSFAGTTTFCHLPNRERQQIQWAQFIATDTTHNHDDLHEESRHNKRPATHIHDGDLTSPHHQQQHHETECPTMYTSDNSPNIKYDAFTVPQLRQLCESRQLLTTTRADQYGPRLPNRTTQLEQLIGRRSVYFSRPS